MDSGCSQPAARDYPRTRPPIAQERSLQRLPNCLDHACLPHDGAWRPHRDHAECSRGPRRSPLSSSAFQNSGDPGRGGCPGVAPPTHFPIDRISVINGPEWSAGDTRNPLRIIELEMVTGDGPIRQANQDSAAAQQARIGTCRSESIEPSTRDVHSRIARENPGEWPGSSDFADAS